MFMYEISVSVDYDVIYVISSSSCRLIMSFWCLGSITPRLFFRLSLSASHNITLCTFKYFTNLRENFFITVLSCVLLVCFFVGCLFVCFAHGVIDICKKFHCFTVFTQSIYITQSFTEFTCARNEPSWFPLHLPWVCVSDSADMSLIIPGLCSVCCDLLLSHLELYICR